MDAIDEAATKFGMPMGPIALHDLVGLDTAVYAGQVMPEAYPDRAVADAAPRRPGQGRPARPEVGRGLPQVRGQEGRPSRPGGRRRSSRSTGPATTSRTTPEITDRLFLPMLLEATRVLEEGIVREPADVDMGLILGIGFPPFRGGILRWADTEGAGKILERLEQYEPLGKRFEPTETLLQARARRARRSTRCRSWRRRHDPHPYNGTERTSSTGADHDETGRGHRRRADPGRAGVGGQGDISATSAPRTCRRYVMRALVERTGIDPKLIEDVRWGCVQQQGEQGFDVARIASLVAGLPDRDGGRDDQPQLRLEPPGDQRRRDEHRRRLRGRPDRRRGRAHGPRPDVEGLQPVPRALPPAQRGDHEHGPDGRVPGRQVPDPARQAGRVRPPEPPARRRGDRPGRVPDRGRADLGPRRRRPQGPARPRTSASAATPRSRRSRPCRPAFNPAGGSVTAGNSSPINVGAAALLMMSEEKAEGARPQADGEGPGDGRRRGQPRGDGDRPGPGRPEGARRAPGLTLDEIDCIELNEAFAVQVLAVLKLPRASARRRSTPAAARSRSATRSAPAARGSPPRSCTGCATRGPVRPGDHVRRPGTGGRDHLRVVRQRSLNGGRGPVWEMTSGRIRFDSEEICEI